MHISQASKKSWRTPIVRELSGAEAEKARNLVLDRLEPHKNAASQGAR